MSRCSYVYDLILRLWPAGRVLNQLANQPVLDRWMQPCFRADDHEAIIIPVQEAVQGTESVVLPIPLLTPLVEQASARAILNECLCRQGENCSTYPHEPGCLILGEGAARLDPSRGRMAGADEALSHVQRSMDQGLVPLVVHAAFDAWLLDIPYRRMLAICFCCDCCCTVRHGLRLGPEAFWDTVVRLPGLDIFVGPACTGCGLCLEVCYIGALSLVGGRAAIASSCKGCGRCVTRCPESAISLHVPGEQQVLAGLLDRIEARTDIGFLSSELAS